MFKCSIKTGGSAFRSEYETDKNGDYILDSQATEVRRLLRQIQLKLSDGYTDGVLIDVNGNRVGEWSIE